VKGTIFNIQEYAVQDGPGIRTTVFLKGCPLRCRWCSNPEGQESLPELMCRVSLCRKCGRCLASCPRGEILRDQDGFPSFKREVCLKCDDKKCLEECPGGALRLAGEKITAEALFARVVTGEAFFRNSGGGVTLSGGEPLFQPEFVGEFLRLSRKNGLSVGLETSGFFEWDRVGEFISLFDFIYFDLKCPDPEIHRRMTGCVLEPILTNLRRLAENGPGRVTVSIPIIPGINDSEDMIAAAAGICLECGIGNVRLLPCHSYGAGKYAELGRKSPSPLFTTPGEPVVEECRAVFLRKGLLCR
jgi:pyruvate formate lyase activating enzyme